MSEKTLLPSILVIQNAFGPKELSELDRVMHEWTRRAARGECGWTCADCCLSFPAGMPDKCAHDQPGCTEILLRDKREAAEDG